MTTSNILKWEGLLISLLSSDHSTKLSYEVFNAKPSTCFCESHWYMGIFVQIFKIVIKRDKFCFSNLIYWFFKWCPQISLFMNCIIVIVDTLFQDPNRKLRLSVSRDDTTGKMRATPEPLKSRSPRMGGAGTLPHIHHTHHTPGCTYEHHAHDGACTPKQAAGVVVCRALQVLGGGGGRCVDRACIFIWFESIHIHWIVSKIFHEINLHTQIFWVFFQMIAIFMLELWYFVIKTIKFQNNIQMTRYFEFEAAYS